ncbi:MAG TPA: hypothetical protein VKA46_04285 [Gemmataceae bacterium]|nr:hypothetical protein [Gemmataceae bacterium]
MEHLLILLFIDLVVAIDRGLQKPLRSMVPSDDPLWYDPEGRLAREEVVIGPRRSYAVSAVLGVLVGCVFSCGFAFYQLEHPRAQRGPLPWPELVLFVAALLLPPVLGFGLFWHWLRGGRLVLRPTGVLFGYRKDRVFCPWALFQVPEDSWWMKERRFFLLAWPPAVPSVVHVRADTVVARGEEVCTKPLYFRRNGELVLRDLYAVRLDQVGGLLLHLGQQLGPKQKLASPPDCGDPVPHDMD